jgi:hypothetical protein
MKMYTRILRGLWVAAVLLWVVAGVPARAAVESTLEVNVPFAFRVGDTTFPPGPTLIERLSETNNSTWAVKSRDGNHAATFLTDEINAETPSNLDEVVFNEVGGKTFLSELWFEGENIGRQAVPSKLEEKLMAKGGEHSHKRVTAQRRESM